jgi:Tetracyclin repressor-like, C-terminal domain
LQEAQVIVDRAVARGELLAGTSSEALVELIIGPALLRSLFMGRALDAAAAAAIVSRAEAALRDDHDVLIPRYSKKRK